MNEPRNWKWAVPALLTVPLLLISYWLSLASLTWVQLIGCIPGMGVLVMMVMAFNNFMLYNRQWQMDLFEQRQRALNITPVVMLSDNLKGLHPEAIKVLNKFGVQTRWGVKTDMETGDRDWLLLDTNVHLGFIEFVLNNSTHFGLYPKNRFAEGSKKWDPDGLVEDREQYDEFQNWLMARLIVTRPFGNQASQFIPPWSPELIKEHMGMIGQQELYKPALPERETNRTFVDHEMDDLIPLKSK